MNNFPSAEDNRLVQNAQRNITQEGVMQELYTALRNSTAKIEADSHDNQQIDQRFIDMQQSMGRMGDEAKEEFGKSTDSVSRRIDASIAEKTKVQATSSNVEVKSEAKSKLHPRLGLRGWRSKFESGYLNGTTASDEKGRQNGH